MADRARPAVYTIPAHRSFADALAAGLIAQFGGSVEGLARGIILLPNNRAVRSISDAFVRRSEKGLLLPRLVPVGDPELGERLGSALDPIGAGADIPPACPPMLRQMILARLVQRARTQAGQPVEAGEAMRLGQALGAALDQLLVEDIPLTRLYDLQVAGDLSTHWQKSLDLFSLLMEQWPRELARLGFIDMADRRNRLLAHIAARWKDAPPPAFVVAAGISATAPAIAALLRTVSRMERGQVVLAELDQHMTAEEWDAIGPFEPDPVTGRRRRAHETHPQFAQKLLLDRMGIAREEVALWRWGGGHDARAVRSRNISNAMLVPRLTTKWRDLQTADRSLGGVEALEAATPAEEAQAIAIALRQALETPGRTAALVTPDRALATRVVAHLDRWGIQADDSAGQPLSQVPAGTLLLALAEAAAERFAPVALLTLLKHPLVMWGEGRLAWLEHVRRLDLLLRGPRPPAGLAGLDALMAPRANDRQRRLRAEVAEWWPAARALLAALERAFNASDGLAGLFDALRETAGAITHDRVWAGHQGHAAAELFAEIEAAAIEGPRDADGRSFPALLERLLEGVAIRPPQGGHPRIAIFGLIEARLQQADLMILSGLNEGTWPALPAPDPWLAPRIRQELGLPGLERRIGLSAHDFASGLGAPHVLITRSRRDASAPAVASRFWLRLKAMAGPQWKDAQRFADLDDPGERKPASQPAPSPPQDLRPRDIAVTDLDRLKADPYAFYARKILGLSMLDQIDADPSAAWRGTAVHAILEKWAEEDGGDPAKLEQRAIALLRSADAHPLMRALWQPRLLEAVRWIAAEIAADKAAGREIKLVEEQGRAEIAGILLKGTADRIDILPGGAIAIVDYKTGKPPSAKMVKAGYAMQLGLLGLIAEHGGFEALGQGRIAGEFEYWSLAKKGDSFGYRERPADAEGKRDKIRTDEFTSAALDDFTQAAARWLTGGEPFTAKLNPEIPTYTDYDQLMRLEEWYGRGEADV
ncbi:double-strand break repair protein AddB [Sphingobium phenoxybenzoativorans]|uniref:Double-strand break repair protein AddB n=1 Tax=Sphingobium phenoxybenzoativorans TaxID=1592790 RepID=A0A975KC44_9SPHN|nr:double-strand break repair protein AddB [Sphingobium phenoxybenzoativorans]QUT07983.1 double-strand break repair protein AddB [Sphingobium phenoxybenzoativorans]